MTTMAKWHDGTEFDFDALPEASRQGMISRAVAHVFGNEVASQVVGKIREAVAGPDGKASAVSTDAIKVYREANPDQVSAWTQQFQVEKRQAILDGKLGVRASGGGTSVDPIVREMRQIAASEIQVLLDVHKLKMPRGDATIQIGDKAYTRADLVDARVNDGDHKDRLEKAARDSLARKARDAKRIADGAGASVAAALGLN